MGSGADALASGLQWAGIAYFAGTMVGDMFGMSDKNSKALGTSLAAGFGAYKVLSTYTFESGGFGSQYLGAYAGPIGFGISAVVFVSMYKDEQIKTVEFSCLPWQAPTGGENCEVCSDGSLPCSEYRCRSSGQGCEIVADAGDGLRVMGDGLGLRPTGARFEIVESCENSFVLGNGEEFFRCEALETSDLALELVRRTAVENGFDEDASGVVLFLGE